MRWRVLIADDEPLARLKLRDHVDSVDWLECVAETADGPSTARGIDRLEPDLVFLDVRMPGASGLEVLERVRWKPHVIFTTAFDRYAVAAFELQALDYLVKPFGSERIERALERARRLLELERAGSEGELERVRAALDSRVPLRRLFVRTGARILPIAIDDIDRFEARGDYVAVWSTGRSHLVDVRLQALEDRLDPARFIRIHRSHIVNLDRVRSLRPYDGSRLVVELADGTRLVASRARSRALRALAV